MIKKRRRMEVTIKDKYTNEEMTFISITKASQHLGMSVNHLSKIIKGERPNVTRYYITTD